MTASLPRIPRPSVQDIRKIFPSAIAVGIILPELGQGLHIEFGNKADFFKELGVQKGSSSGIFCKSLFNLASMYGFINLKNCDVPPEIMTSYLSEGADAHGQFVQDPFHRDYNPSGVEYVTVLVRSDALNGKGREEPTLYATEKDVRNAVRQLPRAGLPLPVIDVLNFMGRDNYHYNLFDMYERPARDVVQRLYPEFTQDVFDLIPEGRKYVKHWKAGVADIAIHANHGNAFLHARATGRTLENRTAGKNPLRGLEIFNG